MGARSFYPQANARTKERRDRHEEHRSASSGRFIDEAAEVSTCRAPDLVGEQEPSHEDAGRSKTIVAAHYADHRGHVSDKRKSEDDGEDVEPEETPVQGDEVSNGRETSLNL